MRITLSINVKKLMCSKKRGMVMKLSKIKLHNYRCFGEEEQTISIGEITAFIGNNSSGKTAALMALSCLFSDNPSERVIKRSDFHLPKNCRPEDLEKQNKNQNNFAF